MTDGARVAQAFYVSLFLIVSMGFAGWLFIPWDNQPSRWQRLIRWASVFMSNRSLKAPTMKPVADPLPATPADSTQGIAKPGNGVNEPLPGNAIADILGNPSPDITAAREAIRFQAKVEDVIAIVATGKIGQTEAIETIFQCKRSGRSDSVYARVRAAVQAQTTPPQPTYRDYPGELARFAAVANRSEED